MSDAMQEQHFEVGALCEKDYGWSLIIDYEDQHNDDDSSACPHAHSFSDETLTAYGGSTYTKKRWLVPRAIVAWNEGGCAQTAVCLDCILDVLHLARP